MIPISNQQYINNQTITEEPMIGTIPGHKPLINIPVEKNSMVLPTNSNSMVLPTNSNSMVLATNSNSMVLPTNSNSMVLSTNSIIPPTNSILMMNITVPNESMSTMNITVPNDSIPTMNITIPNDSIPMIKTNTETNEKNEVQQRINPILKTSMEEEQITNMLNDFIKNNNLSLEEQKHFYDELKKINKNLPQNKKVVISFEKNNFKFQVLDVTDKNLSKESVLKAQSSSLNHSPEIKTYNFDKNMWYISLSSIILTFLIIILLVLKWKESQ